MQSNRKPRLRRSDCSRPGLTRVARGRGFSFQDPGGEPVKDEDEILRIKELAIPPAWKEVWICRDPLGHLQATGVDDRKRSRLEKAVLGLLSNGSESPAVQHVGARKQR